ncbi:hypothetical protein BH09BAC5_BH09BAC5_13660 [soil metagenome]
MKNYILFFVAIAIFTFSCDYVTIPQQAGGSPVTPTSDTIRRILIEDFTGHTCQNCPSAARMIDSLSQIFPGQIIGMGIHNDFFAEPCPPHQPPAGTFPAGAWAEDFRVLAEDADYNVTFGTNGFALPAGMINRDSILPSMEPTPVAAWPSKVAVILAKPISAYIKLTPHYNSSTRALTVDVAGEFLQDTIGTFKVSLFLVEDGLTGYQLDNEVIPLGYQANYDFHHVFRGSVDDNAGTIQGVTVVTGTIPNHTGINYSSPAFTIPANYNAANCKVVGILFKSTDYGVLQAAEADVQ